MLNQVQIIGRVGKDPEVRYLPSGEAVANFSVATTEKWKDKQSGELREETEWHRISTFGRLAEIVGNYVKKGGLVYVSGKVKTRKYTDKDGIEKYATEVRANEMKLLGSKQDGENAGLGGPVGLADATQENPSVVELAFADQLAKDGFLVDVGFVQGFGHVEAVARIAVFARLHEFQGSGLFGIGPAFGAVFVVLAAVGHEGVHAAHRITPTATPVTSSTASTINMDRAKSLM